MNRISRLHPGREMILFALFFLICLGLGYPTLNRYDPRQTGGLSDTQVYYQLAQHGAAGDASHMRYRLLIPTMARAVAVAARDHFGSWDPVFFGFLVVNSLFTAGTAYLLVVAGRRLLITEAAALFGGALYLLNFETANIRLSGMIDSAEGFCFMAIVCSLLSGRRALLPVWSALGAVSRETFVPLCIVFTAAWWWVERGEKSRTVWSVAVIPALAALFSISLLQSVVSGHMITPWTHAAAMEGNGAHLAALVRNIADRNLVYCAVWLLPLGLIRLREFPPAWIAASGAGVITAFALVTWYGSTPGAATRPFFSIAGPLLSLSAAVFISRNPVRP